MKIAAIAEVNSEVFEKHEEVLKIQLRESVCKELMKHNVFIEPPQKKIDNTISMEMHLFALSYKDIWRLQELSKIYPELRRIIAEIVVNK